MPLVNDGHSHPLDLLHEASQRTTYFFPLFPRDGATLPPGDAIVSLLPSLGHIRVLTNISIADAMRHAGEDDDTTFIARTHDVHAIGKLIAARPIAIEILVGVALQKSAYRAYGDVAQGPLAPAAGLLSPPLRHG